MSRLQSTVVTPWIPRVRCHDDDSGGCCDEVFAIMKAS